MSGTNFQKSVWREISKIPYETIISYKELAKSVNWWAYRAQRLRKNPFGIIVPCHRVVASIGGFGAGIDVKRELLLKELFIVNKLLVKALF